MLRCSTLILTIAACLCCTPGLSGQIQSTRSGFPSELHVANDASSSESQLRQRPWLGNVVSLNKYNGALSANASQPSTGPTSRYRLAQHEDPFNEGPFYDAHIKPNSSKSQTKNLKKNLSQIDPRIRTEIEEQVRRDMEKKFESRIQDMVKKQVRVQVRQAQQKLARAAWNNGDSARPVSSSVYRSPNRDRTPPTVAGEVLPLSDPEDSETQQIEHSPARYLITDSRSKSTYRRPAKLNPQEAQLPSQTHTPASYRDTQPVLKLAALDNAPTKPQSVFDASVPEASSEKDLMVQSTTAEVARTDVANADSANAEAVFAEAEVAKTETEIATAEVASNEENTPPSAKFSLSTSVIGPEALLKGQSDTFEITVSNITQQPATNIIVQLTVPGEITISQLDRDAYLDSKNRNVSWKVPRIEAGQKEVIQYRAVSSSVGEYEQEVTLGMENTFQGQTPFTTVVQVGAPSIPSDANEPEDTLEVAERLEFEE